MGAVCSDEVNGYCWKEFKNSCRTKVALRNKPVQPVYVCSPLEI